MNQSPPFTRFDRLLRVFGLYRARHYNSLCENALRQLAAHRVLKAELDGWRAKYETPAPAQPPKLRVVK